MKKALVAVVATGAFVLSFLAGSIYAGRVKEVSLWCTDVMGLDEHGTCAEARDTCTLGGKVGCHQVTFRWE
jgi:hypothetical protein